MSARQPLEVDKVEALLAMLGRPERPCSRQPSFAGKQRKITAFETRQPLDELYFDLASDEVPLVRFALALLQGAMADIRDHQTRQGGTERAIVMRRARRDIAIGWLNGAPAQIEFQHCCESLECRPAFLRQAVARWLGLESSGSEALIK